MKTNQCNTGAPKWSSAGGDTKAEGDFVQLATTDEARAMRRQIGNDLQGYEFSAER